MDPSEGGILQVANLAGPETQEILSNARRLGLTWRLRLATVSSSTSGVSLIRYDGDTMPIRAVCLIGGDLIAGTRVYGLTVPPGSEYVIGYAVPSHRLLYGESGDEDITFPSATAFTTAVTFTTPFAVVPFVVANINSASNQTTGWAVRCQTITTTGFNITVSTSGAANAWSPARRVQWQAIARQG